MLDLIAGRIRDRVKDLEGKDREIAISKAMAELLLTSSPALHPGP